MQNVTVRTSTAERIDHILTKISQTITWDAPPHHRNIRNYTITYEMGEGTDSNRKAIGIYTSNVTQATLVITVTQRRKSIYTVQVAAVSQSGQGEFSDKVELAYAGKLLGLVQCS